MNKRSYGNNLDKFEPRDLNNIYCPNMEQFNSIKQQEVKEIIKIAKFEVKNAKFTKNP